MIRPRIARIPRLTVRAAALLLVVAAACKSSSSDATPADTAAAPPAASPAPMATAGAMAGDTAAAPAASPAATAGAKLDPDAATRETLLAVPGMTAAAADALIAGRPYKSMVAVDQVLAKQLAPEARKTVYAHVWKPIDLNTAAGEEILLIPGVGPRMRHEFEEYRPYKSIEQFRREIGKYVDKAEVARLEQYVTIR
jgi:DNA uptake protein ComE-like DNA-binding protein